MNDDRRAECGDRFALLSDPKQPLVSWRRSHVFAVANYRCAGIVLIKAPSVVQNAALTLSTNHRSLNWWSGVERCRGTL